MNNVGNGDNTEFYINLKKAFGKWLEIETDLFVDTANYSLNERGFDPTTALAWKSSTAEDATITNPHTARSYPNMWENICLGKCALGLNLESLALDVNTISGFNTMQSTPYELIL